MKINIVSDTSSEILQNQIWINPPFGIEIVYSHEPLEADFTFLLGITRKVKVLTAREKTIFVITEPPEILIYPRLFLKQFGLVLGPNFNRYARLGNYKKSHVLIPYHVGNTFAAKDSAVNENINRMLSNNGRGKSNKLSVVTSGKSITKGQRKRLRFIKYLNENLGEDLIIYGRDTNPISDKLTALRESRFHLALENSVHDDYWTEKIMDPLLAGNDIFYFGAPNILEYFPGEGIITLDLKNFAADLEKIKNVMGEKLETTTNLNSANRKILLDKYILHTFVTNFPYSEIPESRGNDGFVVSRKNIQIFEIYSRFKSFLGKTIYAISPFNNF